MKGPPLPPVKCATLPEALAAAADSDEGMIFIGGDEQERRLSWREVLKRARRAASGLASAGVRPGSREVHILQRRGPHRQPGDPRGRGQLGRQLPRSPKADAPPPVSPKPTSLARRRADRLSPW